MNTSLIQVDLFVLSNVNNQCYWWIWKLFEELESWNYTTYKHPQLAICILQELQAWKAVYSTLIPKTAIHKYENMQHLVTSLAMYKLAIYIPTSAMCSKLERCITGYFP